MNARTKPNWLLVLTGLVLVLGLQASEGNPCAKTVNVFVWDVARPPSV